MDKGKVSPSAKSEKRFFYGYTVVVAAFFFMLITNGACFSYGVFFKPMSEEYGWTRAMTAGAYSLSVFVLGILNIVAGRLNDRFGPRAIATVCGFLFGLGYLLMAQITTLWQLYLVYGVLIAAGMSGCFVPLTSTIARWFTRKRGLMTGIVVAGIGVGVAIMPPIATQFIASYGWRQSFTITGIVSIALIVISAQFLQRDPSKKGLLPYGESREIEMHSLPEAGGFPLSQAIRAKQFWMLSIMFFCFAFNLQTVMVHIVPHVTDLGLSAMTGSGIIAVIGGLSIVGRIGIGSIADRIGFRMALVIGMATMSASVLLLQAARELWLFYLFAALFGFAYGSIVVMMSLSAAELFGLSSHGVILGMILFIAAFGETIGPLFAGQIFDSTGSYYPAFGTSAALGIAGLVLALLLKPVRRVGRT